MVYGRIVRTLIETDLSVARLPCVRTLLPAHRKKNIGLVRTRFHLPLGHSLSSHLNCVPQMVAQLQGFVRIGFWLLAITSKDKIANRIAKAIKNSVYDFGWNLFSHSGLGSNFIPIFSHTSRSLSSRK